MSLKQIAFEVPIVTDATVLERARETMNDVGIKDFTIVFRFMGDDQEHTFPPGQAIPTTIEQILSLNSSVLEVLRVADGSGRGVFVSRRRDQHQNPLLTFALGINPGKETDISKFYQLVSAAKKRFQAYDRGEPFALVLDEAARADLTARERELARLQEIAENLIRKTDDYRHQLDREVEEKKSQLEAEHLQARQKLDEEHRQRIAQLDGREAELEQRRRELDDRDSKHARRGLRKDLKDALTQRSEKFVLTKGTVRKRWWVNSFVIVLLLLSGIGASIYFLEGFDVLRELVSSEKAVPLTPIIVLLIKHLTITALFVTTAVFFIRWNTQWFHRHADEEFRLKRLELDIDRASWVVETALEWRREKGEEIPPQLLDRLSTNLFREESRGTETQHPADELASAILGSAASLKLGLPGAEVTLDKKGLKSLRDN